LAHLRFFRFFFAADACAFDAALLAELPPPAEGKNGEEKESGCLLPAAAAALIPANSELKSSSNSPSLHQQHSDTSATQ